MDIVVGEKLCFLDSWIYFVWIMCDFLDYTFCMNNVRFFIFWFLVKRVYVVIIFLYLIQFVWNDIWQKKREREEKWCTKKNVDSFRFGKLLRLWIETTMLKRRKCVWILKLRIGLERLSWNSNGWRLPRRFR